MLKKMLAAALSVVMCISICVCSNSSDTNLGDDVKTEWFTYIDDIEWI